MPRGGVSISPVRPRWGSKANRKVGFLEGVFREGLGKVGKSRQRQQERKRKDTPH